MSVTISSAVKSNLQALQTISSEAAKTQTILSTGKKVNSALDNATSFFTASSLNSRASSLTSLLDGVSNGIQTIQAANSGIGSITKLVDQLRSTAQQALSTSSAYSAKASASQVAITGATSADIRGPNSAAGTTGAGTSLLKAGGTAVTAATALNDATNVSAPFAAGDTLTINGKTVTITTAASGADDDTHIKADDSFGNLLKKIDALAGTTSSIAADKITIASADKTSNVITGSDVAKLGLTASTTYKPTPPAIDGKTLTFQVGTGPSLTVKFGDPAVGGIKSLDDLNSKLSSIGLSASLNASGSLSYTTTSDTSSKTFTVQSGDAATATLTGFANTSGGSASSAPQRGGAGADARDALVTQFNGLLDQINTLAKDASYNGLNLLTGDTLSLVFNETNTSKLSITGQDATFSGLGLSKATATDFNDGGSINSVLSTLDGSKNVLATLSSKLGANLAVVQTRQDFTRGLANTLTTGADNLVNADLNEEATKLLALQTSQSLAQSSLSLANQSNQGVLRLLQ